MTRRDEALEPWAPLAALAVLYVTLFALTDIVLLHPGAAWPDELLTNVRWTQEWREGMPLPMSFFKGCFHRSLLAWFGGIGTPSLLRLHLPSFLAFFAESAFLYILSKRNFSENAAVFSVTINAVAAFTLLRLRSLLSYSVIPAELLGMLVLLPFCRNQFKSLLWGLAAGLLLLEYEVWAIALLVLAVAWLAAPSEERPGIVPAVAGIAIGAALVVALSWAELSDYLLVRASQSFGASHQSLAATILGNLKGYCLGAEALPYTGVSHWPVFPFFAWAGLVFAWREKRWILGWAALGFIPLISGNSAAEPQRMIVAWPALCLLAGAGFSAWNSRFSGSGKLILALMLAGAGLESWAYARSMHAHYAPAYGYSVNLAEAAKQLKKSSGTEGYDLITELDSESVAATRFFLEAQGLKSVPGGRAAAIFSWEYARGLEKQGELLELSVLPGSVPVMLYYPDAKAAARLKGVAAELGPLWRGAPRFVHRASRAMALNYFLKHPQADPWVKSACLEQALGQSFMVGEFPPDLVRLMEAQNLQSVSPLIWAAQRVGEQDPAWAARLKRRAESLDPRRGEDH